MERYEIISGFICAGKYVLVIKFDNAILVMSEEEWQWVYGQLHPDKWKNNNKIA